MSLSVSCTHTWVSPPEISMLPMFPCSSPKLAESWEEHGNRTIACREQLRGQWYLCSIYKYPVCNNVDTPTSMQGTYLTRISGSLSERSSFSCKREQNTVRYCDEECTDILHVPCCLGLPLLHTWVDLRAQVNQQRSQAAQSVFDVRVTCMQLAQAVLGWRHSKQSAGTAPQQVQRGVPDMEQLEKELSKRPAQEPNDTTALTREQQEKLNQHKVLVRCTLHSKGVT